MFGEECRTEICVGFKIGKGTIDPSFRDNAAHLSEILSLFDEIRNDSTTELTNVTFSGSASPEGSAEYNKRLAATRMLALEKYIRDRVFIPDSIVTKKTNGIAWDKLAEMIEESDMPHKDDALRILRNAPDNIFDSRGRVINDRKKQLMELQAGRTWKYMAQHFFGRLRNACSIVLTVKRTKALPKTPVVPQEVKADTISADTIVVTLPVDTIENAMHTAVPPTYVRRPFYMSVKTNMLYDILALPNIGVEFYLGRNWSIAANWMYGWWNSDRHHRYWRAYGGDIAVRKWIGSAADRKPLTGHHVGAYGQILTYDFEFGGKGQLGGEPGKPLWHNPSYAAGVEYGYTMPLTQRLNIDFTIGIGFFGGKYYEYEPIDNHYVWLSTKQRHWVGPTKAEISLVWLLGHGNRNDKKGGAK